MGYKGVSKFRFCFGIVTNQTDLQTDEHDLTFSSDPSWTKAIHHYLALFLTSRLNNDWNALIPQVSSQSSYPSLDDKKAQKDSIKVWYFPSLLMCPVSEMELSECVWPYLHSFFVSHLCEHSLSFLSLSSCLQNCLMTKALVSWKRHKTFRPRFFAELPLIQLHLIMRNEFGTNECAINRGWTEREMVIDELSMTVHSIRW